MSSGGTPLISHLNTGSRVNPSCEHVCNHGSHQPTAHDEEVVMVLEVLHKIVFS